MDNVKNSDGIMELRVRHTIWKCLGIAFEFTKRCRWLERMRILCEDKIISSLANFHAVLYHTKIHQHTIHKILLLRAHKGLLKSPL